MLAATSIYSAGAGRRGINFSFYLLCLELARLAAGAGRAKYQ